MATYVLVHGSLTDGAYWNDVADRLRSRGHDVHVIERLPSTGVDPTALGGLADDVAAVREAVDASGAAVVLVAHSGGGAVITELADHPDVAHSVYVAAAMPERGRSAIDVIGAAGGPMDWIAPGDQGEFWPVDDVDRLVEVLCADAEPERARAVVGRRVATSAATVMTPCTAPERKHPVTYVLTEKDVAFPPAAQGEMAARADHVVRIASGHQPMTSVPDELAAILDRVAT